VLNVPVAKVRALLSFESKFELQKGEEILIEIEEDLINCYNGWSDVWYTLR